MNTHDETAEDSTATSVSGFDELVLADDTTAVKVTIGSSERWDRSHLRRLRQSADLPGLVPVIDSDFASDGKAFAVTPVIGEPTLASKIPPTGPAWQDCAAITEAAARATHEAHLRGLFHGALSPDQIYVVGDDVAVGGIGLGLGGVPRSDYHHWVAPEVLDGMDASERSDVYSLGKILEASLGDSLEDVPRSVRRLIMWSGSDTPEARPPSALEFASILAEALGDDRKTYSPAFIPTAESNALASTASGIVAAHTAQDSSGSTGAAAAAVVGGTAVVGAALASEIGRSDEALDLVDDEEFIDSGIGVIDNDDAAEAEAEVDDAVEVETDDAVEAETVDAFEGDDAAEADTGTEAEVDDAVEVETDDAAEAEVEVDDVVEAEAETESADEHTGVAEDAVITGELDLDDDVDVDITGEAVETTDLDADDLDVEPVSAEAPFDSREYSEGISEAAADTSDDLEVAAAQTVELDRTYQDESRGNRAGILVGAILALGLALIAFQLLRSDDSTDDVAGDDTEQTTDEAGGPTTVDSEAAADATTDATVEESTASTVEESTATTADEPAQTTTTAAPSTTTEQTTTTEVPADTVPAESQVPNINGPVAADAAGLQIVHGIPGADVDIYVDGEAQIPGFTAGTIAGPVDLAAGAHVVDVYAASDDAPAQSGDRTDSPITSQTVTVGDGAATLFAHLDASGNPTLSAFAENTTATDPTEGRLVVRHLAQAPEVTLAVDGEPVADGVLNNGESATISLAAGQHTISAVTADGSTVAEATLSLDDGEMASITVFGAADSNTLDAIQQRFTGLSSAPASVPTGNSNLLGADEDLTSLYILGALTLTMALAGGLVLSRRRRLL